MASWLDQINIPTPEPPPASQTVAPGAWWQPPQQQQQPQQYQQAPQQPAAQYRPQTAGVVTKVERCPRCFSEDYAEVTMDLSFGGRIDPEKGYVQTRKRCFACRYPGPDASGDIIKGKGLPGGNKDVKTLKPRQHGNPKYGSWSDSLWDSAPVIV